MKKIFLFLSFLFITLYSFSQLDSTKTIYCQIVGTQIFSKVTVTIDMGENKGFLALNSSYIYDEATGKPQKFNSMIDALNYMNEYHWDFVQAYAISSGNTNVYNFLLKQTIIKGADGNYYPFTKKMFSKQE